MRLFGIIAGSILLLILVILFIRIRVQVTYSEEGLVTVMKIWFFKLRIPPEKEKKDLKKGERKAAREAEKEEKKLPGGKLSDLTKLIQLGLELVGKALRSIRIDELCADVTIASDNAFQTAMMYGASAAGCGIILPILENNFKIRQKKIRVYADFVETETKVYAVARLSVAVWQLVRLAILFAYRFSQMQHTIKKDERKVNCDGRTDSQ